MRSEKMLRGVDRLRAPALAAVASMQNRAGAAADPAVQRADETYAK